MADWTDEVNDKLGDAKSKLDETKGRVEQRFDDVRNGDGDSDDDETDDDESES